VIDDLINLILGLPQIAPRARVPGLTTRLALAPRNNSLAFALASARRS